MSSTESKRKYNSEHYLTLQSQLDKGLVTAFKTLVDKLGLKQSDVLRYFVYDFISNTDNYVVKDDWSFVMKPTDYLQIDSLADFYVKNAIEHLGKIEDKYSLYDYLHGGRYLRMKDLRGIADSLGLDIENRMSRSEVLFKIYSHYECKLEKLM